VRWLRMGWLEAVLNQLNRSTEGAHRPTTPAVFFYNQLQLCFFTTNSSCVFLQPTVSTGSGGN
jgi:hypothetical protein